MKRVCILGGGFAGTFCARALDSTTELFCPRMIVQLGVHGADHHYPSSPHLP